MVNEATRKVLRQQIGEIVAEQRRLRGWSQAELAALVGITFVQVSRIENGHHEPSASVLYSLADAFKVPTDFFRRTPLNAS